MKCDFSIKHYKEILDKAKKHGYSFCSFFEKPEGKVIYLRHDIDIASDRALALAEIEKQKGIKATYFVQIDSPFYNPLKEKIAAKISSFGHDVGLHYTEGNIGELVKTLNIKRLFSFHRPSKQVLGKKVKGFISAYEPYFFEKVKYIADSRMEWRDKCVCQMLGKYPKLQILIHPIWWQQDSDNPTDLLNNYVKNYPKEKQEQLKDYLRENIESYQS